MKTDIYDDGPWRHLWVTSSKKLLIDRKKSKGSRTMNEGIRIVSKGTTADPGRVTRTKV